jgi:hypothetical protein
MNIMAFREGSRELVPVRVAQSAILTIEMRSVVASVISMMPGLCMTYFASSIVDGITVCVGVWSGLGRKYNASVAAVGCLHHLIDQIEIWSSKFEEIVAARTTINMMILGKQMI